MKQLSKNWLTENHIDLEYKQYVLLAYLEEVHHHFQDNLLYPSLSELIEHYRELKKFQVMTDSLYQRFPGNLKGVDLERVKLLYDKVVTNDQLMDELEKIVAFSLPRFEASLQEGKSLYEHTEKHMRMEPVGLVPLRTQEGYLMLELQPKREIRVYEYAVSQIEYEGEPYRSMHTQEVATFESSLQRNPNSIKAELIKMKPEFPNPAAYVVSSTLSIPLEETCLPVAKRMLMREINRNPEQFKAR